MSLDKAHSLNPKDENIFILTGQVKIILGHYDDAIETFNKALDISENRDEIFYQVGLAYQANGKFNNATENFKKAIDININLFAAKEEED